MFLEYEYPHVDFITRGLIISNHLQIHHISGRLSGALSVGQVSLQMWSDDRLL